MAQLSLGIKGRRKRGLNIAAIPNCELWIDVARTETHSYASGTNLSQIADLSGKNRHMTKTGAGDETVYPTYSATERGAVFLNNAYDQMIAGTNSDWNFLHNGDGCSILMLVKVDTAQPASNGVLLSSSSEASGGVGINLWYYNTNQNYYFSMRNPMQSTQLLQLRIRLIFRILLLRSQQPMATRNARPISCKPTRRRRVSDMMLSETHNCLQA